MYFSVEETESQRHELTYSNPHNQWKFKKKEKRECQFSLHFAAKHTTNVWQLQSNIEKKEDSKHSPCSSEGKQQSVHQDTLVGPLKIDPKES